MTPYITCSRIVKVYRVGDHELVALRGIDFEMERGEMVAIIGPSGAGKSSLLNLLGGLDVPTAGKLIVDGQNLLELKGRALASYRLRRVGFVWQQVERNLLSYRSALRNVTLPMMLAGVPVWQRVKQARDLLDAVGLSDQGHKHPSALSGGQQQRVAVAVALANRPPLLLADEPTGALDRKSAAQVMDLLQDLRRRYDLTVLMVTHDLSIAGYADRVLTLRDGALGQDLTRDGEETPTLDEQGMIHLPSAARSQLAEAQRIAVEIRPEGVLLRPEAETPDDANAMLQDMVPQDAPPEKRWRFLRRKVKTRS
jgi:putative ABC transport system ATP-binding protein